MAKTTPVSVAKEIMGSNFIGVKQVNMLLKKMDKPLLQEISAPPVIYDEDTLKKCSSDFILVYGSDCIDILDIRNFFGVDPDISEPCLYNQDWYMAEDFIHRKLENKWYLIKKNVLEDSRACMPDDIMAKGVDFPSAILCTYTFFVYWASNGEKLWYHDFVWCEDVDHNGDRIYVGKYNDVDGVNKNGFSIHRHLALRKCYASTIVL